MSLLIKDVFLYREKTDIFIENNTFTQIAPEINRKADKIIYAHNKAIVPAFYNGHTHAAMTLLRGFADDLRLFSWLNDYIWPMEDEFTPQDIYTGSRLAIIEMIRTGTVFFNDMYWENDQTIRAVEEMGVRANIGMTFIDSMGKDKIDAEFRLMEKYLQPGALSDRVQISVAPHAVYTVGEELFRRCVAFAKEKKLNIHVHLAETKQEVKDCVKATGMTPVRWVNHLGGLTKRTIAAHVVHADKEEAELLSQNGVTLVHNPISNMKLASGVFNLPRMQGAGCTCILGTDGCSSNNNLDMREEMKFAALLAKSAHKDVELLPAKTIFWMATSIAADAFNLNAGRIEKGRMADALLLDLDYYKMVPRYSLISNWVYSADSGAIDTVICNGKVLMENRIIPGEEEIIEQAKETSVKLRERFRRR